MDSSEIRRVVSEANSLQNTAFINTGNATATTIFTFSPNDGDGGLIEVMYGAMDTSGNILAGKKIVRYKRLTTTTTLGTPVDIMSANGDVGLSTASFSFTTSGTDILFQVTGIASTSINWNIKFSTLLTTQVLV